MRNASFGIAALVLSAACASVSSPPRVAVAGGLVTGPSVDWIALAPGSSMRVAEYRVPGPGGDASLIVYHFGKGGGSVEDNFERWTAQFEAPDGGAVRADFLSNRPVGSLTVSELRIGGRYVAEVTPGSAERHDEPGWRMLAAVVETPVGAYYPKLVGPEATVRANEAAWNAYLATLGFAG